MVAVSVNSLHCGSSDATGVKRTLDEAAGCFGPMRLDPSARWLDFAYGHVMERASLFRLDVGELDHLGPRSSATQIGNPAFVHFRAHPNTTLKAFDNRFA